MQDKSLFRHKSPLIGKIFMDNLYYNTQIPLLPGLLQSLS